MNKLHGKRALVTAGAQGIGLAISRQLLASGCDVFVHYRSSADAARGLEAEAEALGRRYAHAAADLTESLECDRLVGEAVKFLGGLDVLVNNAGSLVYSTAKGAILAFTRALRCFLPVSTTASLPARRSTSTAASTPAEPEGKHRKSAIISRSNFMPGRERMTLRIATVAAVTLCAAGAHAADESRPTNDLPNPYQSIAPWGDLPEGRTWGALNAVAIDNDGESVWVANRCGANPDIPLGESPFTFDSCAGSIVAPVMKFDSSGKFLRSFGASLFIFPHKIYVDADGNVWVADARSANDRERKKTPNEKPKGHVVVKFSPEGKVLLTIGTPGVAGDPPRSLTEPTSIVTAPNGDIFIAEGHSGQYPGAGPNTVARISKFTKDGKFVKSFGRWGAAPGEFKTPHDIALDSRGRLFVADRGNMRIQILDQDGAYIAEWTQFSRPSGIYMRDGMIYVADSESNGLAFAAHPGWKRGIRIGSVKDGQVLYRIPDPLEMEGTSAAEGLAVDAKGNVYGGEVGPRQLVKHVRQH